MAAETRTGGRDATSAIDPGRYSLSVGRPNLPSPYRWTWTKLTDVARLETGHTPSRKRSEYWGGDIPWIGIKDATHNDGRRIDETMQKATALGIENSSARLLPTDTVCLSRTASVGYVVVMGRPMATSQDFVNWVCDDDRLDWRFLKWALLAERQALRRWAHGTTHQTIYFPEVKAFHINLPPRPEQQAIASVLGALDDKIENNRRAADAAEAVWLTAVSHTLGDAPRVKVADLIAAGTLVVNDGYRAKNSELAEAGIPFLRAGNLTADGLALDDADMVPPDVVKRAGFKVARPWDTAFTSKGTVGRITLVGPQPEPFVYSPQICFWRSITPDALSPLVLHAWMRSARFVAQVDSVKGQTDMADYVSLRDQRAMVIDVPSEPAQREAHELAEPMARMACGFRREARAVAAIRDALLPKLVSGRIRVRLSDDPEEIVGVALEAHGAETAG